jgi:hypothetical protein
MNFNFIASLTFYYIEDGKQTRSKKCIAIGVCILSAHRIFLYSGMQGTYIGTTLDIVADIVWLVF